METFLREFVRSIVVLEKSLRQSRIDLFESHIDETIAELERARASVDELLHSLESRYPQQDPQALLSEFDRVRQSFVDGEMRILGPLGFKRKNVERALDFVRSQLKARADESEHGAFFPKDADELRGELESTKEATRAALDAGRRLARKPKKHHKDGFARRVAMRFTGISFVLADAYLATQTAGVGGLIAGLSVEYGRKLTFRPD